MDKTVRFIDTTHGVILQMRVAHQNHALKQYIRDYADPESPQQVYFNAKGTAILFEDTQKILCIKNTRRADTFRLRWVKHTKDTTIRKAWIVCDKQYTSFALFYNYNDAIQHCSFWGLDPRECITPYADGLYKLLDF